MYVCALSIETCRPAVSSVTLLLAACYSILLVSAAVAPFARNPKYVRPLPIVALLASRKIAAISVPAILASCQPIELRLLSLLPLHLGSLALRLPVLSLRPAVPLRHLPLDLTRLLTNIRAFLSLRLSLHGGAIPLRHLSLKIRLLTLELGSLCLLPLHLPHLGHLPFHLRPLLQPHLRHLALCLLLPLWPLHLRTLLTLRSLSLDLRLPAASAPVSAPVPAAFTLRGNVAETAYGEHQQERKK